mgnify:CR=1 FL=1
MIKAFNFENDVNEFSANTYIIGKKDENCLIVDLGTTSDVIINYVKKNFKSVSGILLTHAHLDHIRGVNNFLKAFPKTPVYISKLDAPLLNEQNKFYDLFQEKVPLQNYPLNFVNDGDVLNFKNYIVKVIATPFHTKGSVCYLFSEDNALFTGDTLFKGSIGRTDLYYSEPNKIYESLAKLSKLPSQLVCYPGHGLITTLKEEKESNPYLRD